MAVTIKDIALAANLSPATVSMVLNNKPGISELTREKVLEIAKELSYNVVSTKRLPQGPTGTLPFIVYRKHGQVIAETPFFSSMIEAIENEARNNGCQISIHYLSAQSDTILSELKSICQNSSKGALILATEMNCEDYLEIESFGVPYVLIDNSAADVIADKVLMNNYEGARNAVRQLVNYGHKKIGYLHSSVWINNFSEREAGFRSALKDSKLSVCEDWIVRLKCTHEGAYSDMLAWLKTAGSLPTAFYADNDIIAMGAMKALKERKFAVPNDVSIIGFDDMPFCTMVEPNLSTMRVDTGAIAAIAVRLLLQKNTFKQKIEVSTIFIERNSIRRI